jgi:hypothetical protein
MADLKFNIFVDNDKLKRGLNGAKKELTGFEKASKKISSGFKSALGGVGLALGIGAIVTGLKNATIAAAEDAKAQKLLANQLRNTVNATDQQIYANEKYIKGLSLASGIADDQLRPALANAVRATGSLSTAQGLLQIGLDGSAASGKSLQTYMAALTKAQNGNFTALYKLEPQLKKTKGSIDDFADSVEGAAKANADPFARFNIAISEISESVGTLLLPVIEGIANFIVDVLYPAIDKFFTDLNDPNTFTGQAFAIMQDTFKGLYESVKSIYNAFAEFFKSIGIDGVDVAIAFLKTYKYISTQFQFLAKNVEMATTALIALYEIQIAISKGDVGGIGTALGKFAARQKQIAIETGRLVGELLAYDPKIALSKWEMPEDPFGNWNPDTLDDKAGDALKKALERMKKAAEQIKKYGESFRDSVDLALGLNQSGTRFSADRFIRQLQRAVDAAKKLPGLLTEIRASKKTGSTALANQIAGLDPIQGAAIAEGIISSGRLGDILSLRNTLQLQGQRTALAGAGNAVYSININKANITGAEIVAAIKQFERSTGRQVLING